jgi:hypothetical protein
LSDKDLLSVDTTLNIDFRFLETHYELYALKAHLELIESNLPMLQEREVSSAWQDLRDKGLDNDEAEIAIRFDDVNDRVKRIYPRYFRGSFLIMLVAVLESGLEEIANYRAKHTDLEGVIAFDKFNGLRRESFLERLDRYYNEQLRQPHGLTSAQLETLKLLYQVRNRLAHGNGRPTRFRHSIVFDDWEALGIGITVASGGNLDFSREFVENSYQLVRGCLEQMIEDAKAAEDSAY